MRIILPAAAIAALAIAGLHGGSLAQPGGASASGKQQTGNAGANAIQDRSAKSPAEALFVEKCGMCHRNFGMGTVLIARRVEKGQEWLEKRDDLTAEYVISAARSGMGNMPRVPRGEVSDKQLATIAAYLAKGKK